MIVCFSVFSKIRRQEIIVYGVSHLMKLELHIYQKIDRISTALRGH